VLAELQAAGEAVRRAGGDPARALRAVEGGAAFFSGFLAMRMWYDLGEARRAQGNVNAAVTTCRQALEVAGARGQAAYAGPVHVGLAQALYERNELTAALEHASQGVALCRQLAFTPALAAGLAVLARIRQARGDAAGARQAMKEAGQAGISSLVSPLLSPVPSQRARLLVAQGDVDAAAQWARAAGLRPDDEPDYPREPAYLALVRVLLARNDPGPALTLLRHLLEAADRQGRAGSVIEIQALRSLALAARGERTRALDALAEALALACGHGHVRIFADEGAPMRALVEQLAAARRVDPGCLAILRRAFDQPGAAPPGLAGPLTGRELEVLRMIAAGSSNQRIARELVMALDTVKKHVSHVLGKLGAANRTEAAALARQRGLIP
jgi:LuxR family maltose regulon positive regulatory protein